MTPRLSLVMLALAALCTAGAVEAQESFTATATVRKGSASASGPVTISVTRYATEKEIDSARAAARTGGPALRKALSAMEDAGFIQLGEQKTAIKLAAQRSTGAGRLVTLLTAEPVLFLGAGVPTAKPRAGFEVAIAMLDISGSSGKGELAPAAKVSIDAQGAIVIEDYGATVIWLNDVATKKTTSR